MILLDELKTELNSYIPEIKELADVLNIENSKVELEELRNKAAEPGFWDDLEKSQQVLQKTKAIENKIEALESLSQQLDDLIALTELCIEENDEYQSGSDNICADLCLTARGNSMINANIFDGDIVYIRYRSMVNNGEIAAVIVDNSEVTLKRFFYYKEKNQVILQPENPMYEPLVYSGSELNSIRIVGKAVAVTHHL